MFNYPATELFDANGSRRVVWSVEEYTEAIAAGCTEERPVVEPSPELLKESVDEAPAPVKRGPGRPKKGGGPNADE